MRVFRLVRLYLSYLRPLWIGLLVIFCLAHFLRAQSADSSPSSTQPSAGSPTTPADISGIGGTGSFGSSSNTGTNDDFVGGRDGRALFGREHGSIGGNSSGAGGWNPFVNDVYQMGMRSSRMGGRPENLESLFQMGGKLSQDLDKYLERGFGAGNNGVAGTALGVLPKLNQIERKGLKLPVDSPLGQFQFAYRDQLGKGADAMGGGIGRVTAGATFNSTGLRNDMMHFSASAMFGGAGRGMGSSFSGGSFAGTGSGGASGDANGMFTMGGMNGAGIGSGSSFGGGMTHGGMGGEGAHGRGAETGPSVSLKLTFK